MTIQNLYVVLGQTPNYSGDAAEIFDKSGGDYVDYEMK